MEEGRGMDRLAVDDALAIRRPQGSIGVRPFGVEARRDVPIEVDHPELAHAGLLIHDGGHHSPAFRGNAQAVVGGWGRAICCWR